MDLMASAAFAILGAALVHYGREEMETVTVVHPNDPEQRMIINRTDYNPKKHKLWSEKEAEDKAKADAEAERIRKEAEKGGKK